MTLKPWLTTREIEVLEYTLEQLSPEYCLEYGAGGSTVHFAPYAKRQWISVEHNRIWFERVLQCTGGKKEYDDTYLLLKQTPHAYIYGGQPYHSENGFDYIMIDGWKRIPCHIWSYEIIKPDGIVVIHDISQSGYFDVEVAHMFKYEQTIRHTNFWMGSKRRDLQEFFNDLDGGI